MRPALLGLLSVVLAFGANAETWRLRTFAGTTSGGGYGDGLAREARFSRPTSVAACSDALFIADTSNHAIRRLSRDGVVTTWAGKLTEAGHADGARDAARFRNPVGIAADAACNLLVVDRDNHTIRRIDATGNVTTIAGARGETGNRDGAGSAARFNGPQDVAIDAGGAIWISDGVNRSIRRIETDGQVVTVARLPNANSISPHAAKGITFGPSGDLYIADSESRAIYRMTSTGVTTTVASNVSGADVAFDAEGTLFVVSPGESVIQRVGTDGKLTVFAGRNRPGSSDGPGTAAGFYQPLGISRDVDGTLLVADGFNCTIRRITAAGEVSTIAGTAAAGGHVDDVGTAARFEGALDLDVDADGVVWVADLTTLRRIAPDGTTTTIAGTAGESAHVDGSRSVARFGALSGIAIEPGGSFAVIDGTTVRRVTREGQVTTIAGAPGAFGFRDDTGSAARFSGLTGIAVAPDGTIYVTDALNGAIRKIAGDQVSTFARDRRVPSGIDVDRAGNVFLWAENESSVSRFTPTGAVSVVAANDALGGYLNGIAIAPDGTIYIAGIYRHAIYRVRPGTSAIERFLGDDDAIGNVNGAPTEARFFSPARIAVGADGRLYIRDLNKTIRLATREEAPTGPRRRPARR